LSRQQHGVGFANARCRTEKNLETASSPLVFLAFYAG
jgi:hypothetical protein